MFEILPHTADVRIRVESSSLEGLFEDAARAIVSLCELELRDDSTETRDVNVESVDSTSLLVDFLNELLAILHVDYIAFDGFKTVSLDDTRLRALVRFRPAASWAEDIKAVTYHEARLTRESELWTTMLVLDI